MRIAPKIEEFSKGDYKDNVVFLKVDVEEAEKVAEEYKVDAMPTFVLFKKGEEVDRTTGANLEKIKECIEKNLK